MTNILNSLSRKKINDGLNIGNIFSSSVGTYIDTAKMRKDGEF